jgi:chorismate mutase
MELTKLRKDIDGVDKQLLELLKKRNALSRQVGHYKRLHNLAFDQPGREKILLKARSAIAKKFGIDIRFVSKLFTLILSESKKVQSALPRVPLGASSRRRAGNRRGGIAS